MPREYTADTIDVAQNLAQIRRRPTAFISDKGNAGQVHMLREIIDNSVDELVLRESGGTIYICLFRDRVNNRYQIAIQDNGRGIPSKSLESVTTKLGASGKASADTAYVASGGLFGFGFKVSAALSLRFRCITSNYLEDVCASIYLRNGEIVSLGEEQVEELSGVLTIVEPDIDQFFNNNHEFMESGYLDLVSICRQLNIFNPTINFQFYVYDRKIPDDIWTADIKTTLDRFRSLLARPQKTIEYDSFQYPDKASYLFDMWHIDQKPIWSDTYVKFPANNQDRLGFNVKLFFMKKSNTGRPRYFISVNNISLPDVTGNSATVAFMLALRTYLINYIENIQYKEFVQTDYQFPTMCLAIGIWYHNAELSGATKTSFRDEIFADQFYKDLLTIFRMKPDEYWTLLVDNLMSDIELQYNRVNDIQGKKVSNKNTLMKLNFPNNYYECKIFDPEKSELYIVEGTSAGNIRETRNPDYQALYETRGKPENCATDISKEREDRLQLLKNLIFKDILTILGIQNVQYMTTPRVRFSKIIIATDADTDGSHIRVIHIHDFYIANPLFITSGFVWLANPPLYSMSIPKGGKLFLRDRTALLDARVRYIYEPSLEIESAIPDPTQPDGVRWIPIKGEAFRDLCYLINYLGSHFELVAKQLSIPLMILERLVMAVDALFPRINYIKLMSYFNCEESVDNPEYIKISTNEAGRYIVISVGKEDFPIGLDMIGRFIVDHLQKLVIKYKYNSLMFKISSKHKGATIHNKVVSAMGLYVCLKLLDQPFKVSRYKGLGEMNPEDCFNTLMNPNTRSLTRVVDVGDPLLNYQLLGKDTTARKVLLNDTGVISNAIMDEDTNI